MTVEGEVGGSESLVPRGVSILAPSEVIGVERRGGRAV